MRMRAIFAKKVCNLISDNCVIILKSRGKMLYFTSGYFIFCLEKDAQNKMFMEKRRLCCL